VYFKENVEEEDLLIEEKDYSFALHVSNVVKSSSKPVAISPSQQ
jgi:hypothetical protein